MGQSPRNTSLSGPEARAIIFSKKSMRDEKELAYRYDLFIATGWRDRFDTLINENIKLPIEGEILDINCGTGAHAIELAERIQDKGEVIGVDPGSERIAVARAKALVKKLDNVRFEQSVASELPFDNDRFDTVVGDGSMTKPDAIEALLIEMRRVCQPDGRVILKLATHGSFDEFFSIYWEALHETGIDDTAWSALEKLISERLTVSDVELMVERSGLRNIEGFTSKEEFSFESAEEFLISPLIEDYFLPYWFEIIPAQQQREVRQHLVSIIDRERHTGPFEVSIKATVITGLK
jgi:ubiquinone/menaquinone biosynthesis C-methylase UbiE